MRTHHRTLRSGAFLLFGMTMMCGLLGLTGCSSPKQEPPPPPPRPSRLPNPPQLREITLGRPDLLQVGDTVSIVLDAVDGQIPLSWQLHGLPQSWERITGSEGRFYQLTGRVPMGASAAGIDFRATVVDGNRRSSEALPIHIDVEPKTYDFQPSLLSTSEDELVREYELRLRALPDWDPAFAGRLEIWVDTVGLSSGPDASDSLRLWDAAVDAMDRVQSIRGDSASASGIAETGETFSLSSPIHIEALQDSLLRLTVRSGNNPNFRIAKVRITAY